MESLEQMRDPAFQAGKLSFRVGAVVVQRKKPGMASRDDNRHMTPQAVAAHDDRLYTIKSVLDGKWMLAIEEAGVFVWVNTPELVTDWSVTKKTNSMPIARLHS